jgi:hypothetical protein
VFLVDLGEFLLISVVFVGGCVFFYLFSWAVKRQARKYQMATAGARGREQKKADDSEMLAFIDELANAWEKKPTEHKLIEFMTKDGGGLICLHHGPLILKHANQLTKMIVNRMGIGKEEAAELLTGLLPGMK